MLLYEHDSCIKFKNKFTSNGLNKKQMNVFKYFRDSNFENSSYNLKLCNMKKTEIFFL